MKKPVFGREGANVSILKEGKNIHENEGPNGNNKNIYQE